MKDQGRGPATYVVPWAPHLLNWALPPGRGDIFVKRHTLWHIGCTRKRVCLMPITCWHIEV